MTRSLTVLRHLPILLCSMIMGSGGGTFAHPGEDHGTAAPAAATPTAEANALTTSASSEQFELVVKYPAPEATAPVHLRLFLSDFATNRPVEGASFTLAFRPAGVTVAAPPKQVSPGIYDVSVTLPGDTSYTMVATVSALGRTDFLEVKNIYAGDAAERFLAEHSTPMTSSSASDASGFPMWGAVAIALAVVAIGTLLVIRRRSSKPRRSVPMAATRDPELASLSADEHRDESNESSSNASDRT